MLSVLRRIVPDVVRRSYATKFAIALLVLGLTVGAIGVGATGAVESAVEDNTHEDYETRAAQEASALESWHNRQKFVTTMLAESEAVRQGQQHEVQSYIRYWQEQLNEQSEKGYAYRDWKSQSARQGDREYAYAVHYVDLENETIAASTNRLAGTSMATLDLPEKDYRYLRQSLSEGEIHTSDVYELDADGDAVPAMSYARLVPDDPNRAIVYTVDISAYSGTFQSAGDASTTTVVVDGNDRVAFDDAFFGDGNRAFLEPYGDGEIVAEIRAEGSDGSQARRVDNGPTGALAGDAYGFPDESYVVGAARVEGTDWVVLVHQPTSEAYGFVDAVSQYGIYVTGAIVLLIGIVGTVLGRNTAVAIDRLTSKTAEMEAGDLEVDLETDRIDNIGRLYDGFASMRDALREQIYEARQAREEAEQARAETERMNEHLEAKAREYQRVMDAAAEGDLTVRMDAESENEAMERIGRTFNGMLADIEATTEQLKRFAAEVATASEQVTASSEEVRSASEQVTESIQEISDGAERQNESLQSVSREMSSLSASTAQIASSSNEVADIAERTARTGREGREAARNAIEGMNAIEAESEETVAEIERLQEEVAQIDELLEFITEVAEQTNMLALNANIEASRSGGSSDGFGVVAEEVKELAADTKEAAEDIEDRLEQIKAQTDATAEEVRKTSSEISRHTDSVRDAADALEEIAGYANETNTGVQEISAATEEQAASTQQVVTTVDEAATISEETTAEAENVAAAAEEQTTALTEVSRSASDLATQASQLSEALDRFDTDVDSTDRDDLLAPTSDDPDQDDPPSDDSFTRPTPASR